MSFSQWLGDLLRQPGDIVIDGHHSKRKIRQLLRRYGFDILYMIYRKQPGAGWRWWRVDTGIVIGRYQRVMAAEILRANGYPVIEPEPGEYIERIPPGRYARRIAMIQRRIDDERRRAQYASKFGRKPNFVTPDEFPGMPTMPTQRPTTSFDRTPR